MAFTVEDGTGILDANSYVDVEFADSYLGERGVAVWTGEDEQKQIWLIQATDYVEEIFARRFIGIAKFGLGYLSWPRTDADPYSDSDIPTTLKRAVSQYAVRAIAGPLLPDPTVDANGFATVVTKKVIGPIEKDFQVMGTSGRIQLVRSYPAADGLMTPLLRIGTGGTRTTR